MNLDREVTIAGDGDRLTIWNRQAYAEHQADVDDALANFFDR